MNTLSTSKQKLSLAFKIIKDTVQGFVDDNVMRLSASLAYATLFSIIPLFSLLITIGVFLQIDLTDQLYTQIEPVVGQKLSRRSDPSSRTRQKQTYLLLQQLLALELLYFSATTVFAEIQSSLNTIWGIKAVPRKSWLKYIKNRLLSFSVILVFAFILLITFTITNLITDLSNRYIANNPDVAESLVKVIGIFVNIVVTTIIFTLIFKILPDAKIKSKDVFIGAVCNYCTIIGRSVGNIVLYSYCKH